MTNYWRSVCALRRDMLLFLITPASIGVSFFGGVYSLLFNISEVGYRPLFLAGVLSSAAGASLFWGYFRTPRGEFARRLDVAA